MFYLPSRPRTFTPKSDVFISTQYMHQFCKFGEKLSITFQHIVLMFGKQGQTHEQTRNNNNNNNNNPIYIAPACRMTSEAQCPGHTTWKRHKNMLLHRYTEQVHLVV